MLKDNLVLELNKQVNREIYSSYLYLAMSSYADKQGFKGFANWLYIQAQEELAHGTHMFQYILERGATPTFSEIASPKSSFNNMRELFEEVQKHERWVSECCNNIATAAIKENDHTLYMFIQWYLNEQVEEEANADLLVQKLTHIGDNMGLLLNLDKELATRVYVDPFQGTQSNA